MNDFKIREVESEKTRTPEALSPGLFAFVKHCLDEAIKDFKGDTPEVRGVSSSSVNGVSVSDIPASKKMK